MRYLFLSLLIAAMLFQSFSKAIIYASYIENRDFIAKNLCENRSRPEMHCNGKCHLRKQLQKDEQNDHSQLPSSLKLFDESISLNQEQPDWLFEQVVSIRVSYPELNLHFPVSPVTDIFHPPSV